MVDGSTLQPTELTYAILKTGYIHVTRVSELNKTLLSMVGNFKISGHQILGLQLFSNIYVRHKKYGIKRFECPSYQLAYM
jgi:hypothetical protein